ncbi:MAG: hypothetical protein QGH74_02790 [Candidatus Brocadiia bacterium]|jgi:hypothetical protein|nr:hypothetical protein [Candidatus Brocadiia bacterium]
MEANRPTSVTVFGVLNIALGALHIIGWRSWLVTMFRVVGVIGDEALLLSWVVASHVVALVATIVLIAAGVGLLGLKPWARTASIVYAIYAIVAWILRVVINPTLVLPQAASTIGGTLGRTCALVVALVYPFLLISFMTSPKVVAAFRK